MLLELFEGKSFVFSLLFPCHLAFVLTHDAVDPLVVNKQHRQMAISFGQSANVFVVLDPFVSLAEESLVLEGTSPFLDTFLSEKLRLILNCFKFGILRVKAVPGFLNAKI